MSSSKSVPAKEKNPKPRAWRDVLPIHPAAEIFPLMSGDELRALGEDIRKTGLTSPITVTSIRITTPKGGIIHDMGLLDGRNRLDAMELVGLPFTIEHSQGDFSIKLDGRSYPATAINSDPYAFVVSANIHRRHLTAEQKRDLIAKLLKATPEKSDRAIGKMAKADGKTVAAVRAEQEGRAEFPHVEKREDTKGRKQPARKAAAEREIIKRPHGEVWERRPVRNTRRAEAERMDEEARGLAIKLLAQLDDATARELQRQLYTGDHRVLWRLAEALGRKLKCEGFDYEEEADCLPQPKRGRPKGSKNKPKSPPAENTPPQRGGDNAPPPEVGAEIMKAKMAALDDGLDIPANLRRGAP
jgi:hypothetical protein